MSKKSLLKTLIREKIKKINEVYHGSHLWRSYYFVSLAFFNHKGINSKDEFIYKDLELKFSKKHFLIGEKMFFARNDVKNRKNFGHGLNAINKFINEKKLTHLENFSFKDFRFSSKEEIIKYFKNNLEYLSDYRKREADVVDYSEPSNHPYQPQLPYINTDPEATDEEVRDGYKNIADVGYWEGSSPNLQYNDYNLDHLLEDFINICFRGLSGSKYNDWIVGYWDLDPHDSSQDKILGAISIDGNRFIMGKGDPNMKKNAIEDAMYPRSRAIKSKKDVKNKARKNKVKSGERSSAIVDAIITSLF
jgi:hypothetical protein